VLSIATQNVSSAYTAALISCAEYLGINRESAVNQIKFHLSTEFFDSIMSYQDRAAWLADITIGAMPMSDYWEAMRKSGLTKKTDEELEIERNKGEGI
jgi:hypothetical protein